MSFTFVYQMVKFVRDWSRNVMRLRLLDVVGIIAHTWGYQATEGEEGERVLQEMRSIEASCLSGQ